MKTILFSAALVGLSLSLASAKPMSPFPMTKVLSSGDSLTYYERGDESYHYFESADGYLLIQDSTGTFYFADSAANISKHKALNADERSAKDKAFLNSLDKAKVKSLYREKTGVKEFIRTPTMLKRSSGKLLKPTVNSVAQGAHKFLVVMVYTSSKSYQANNTKTELSNLLNESGYSNHGNFGSVRDYYVEQSNGAFTPTFDVYGPVQVSLSSTIKNTSDDEIITKALKATGITDYSQYTSDGKYLDGVIVMTPGTDTEGKGSTYEYYCYSDTVKAGNYKVGSYIIAPELGSGSKYLFDGMGTITHEFGHLLGLMDHYVAYNATNGTALTPTYWDVMDVGCYNGTYSSNDSGAVYGTHVPNFSAFERQSLGWLTPTELSTTDGIYAVDSIQGNTAYTVSTSNDDEWFLIENRQQKGWDSELPGHGLLVWHIDYNQTAWDQDEVNSDAAHQRVDIEEASTSSLASYAYPTGASTFNNFVTWSSSSAHSGLYNITEKNGIVCFTLSSGTAVTNCALGSSSSTVVKSSSSTAISSSSVESSSSTTESSSATYSEAATLTKCGTGRSRQTVAAGSAITDFCYTWTNANTVSVTGLPDGVTATINQDSSKVSISGTVSASDTAGIYTFTVTTVGAATNATKSGAITVTNTTEIFAKNALYGTPSIAIAGKALSIEVPMNGSKTLECYSLEGELLRSIPFSATSLRISAASLPAKVFLARIKVNGKLAIEKMIALP